MEPAERLGLVLLGGSAGSLEVISAFAAGLPRGFPWPIAVVCHLPAHPPSIFPASLRTRTELEVCEPDDKERLLPGTIYVAPANYHLLFERDGTVALSVDDAVLYSRPSIDVSFDSAARVHGPGLLAFLLSGASPDGARGLTEVARRGGTTVVQAPETARVATMPRAALGLLEPSAVLEPGQLAAFAIAWALERAS
jgi:two-component system chemotaxis response regulator CheB